MSGLELWNLEREELKRIYDRELDRLHGELLKGVAWEDTIPQRKRLAEISNILYKKSNPRQFGNPAEGAQRAESPDHY